MLSTRIEAEVIENATTPRTWTVEALDTDGDGGVDVTVFSGPDARARAIEYANWKYDVVSCRDAT